MKSIDFITIKDGVITGYHSGDIDVNFAGTVYVGQERREVPFNNTISVGDLVSHYDKNWHRYDDIYLYKNSLLPVPEGMVLNGDTIREMTPVELIKAGITELEKGFKIENDEIIEMTILEKVESKQITESEIECLSISEKVKYGFLTLAPTQKLDGEQIVEKTDREKIEEKLITIPNTWKLEGDYLVLKSQKELYDENIITAEEYNVYVDQQRQTAYQIEADPLGMQVLRGEVDKGEWLRVIEDIKRRYPKVKVDE